MPNARKGKSQRQLSAEDIALLSQLAEELRQSTLGAREALEKGVAAVDEARRAIAKRDKSPSR